MCSPVAMCAVVVSKTSCKDRNHRSSHHTKIFFFCKNHDFSRQFFQGCCGENPPGPGPARDRSRDPGATAQTRARARKKEGREGKREGRSGPACGAERSGPAARMDGSIDRWTGKGREQEIERREGTEGSRQNQKRERNERVAWTAVVGVCFIDRTSHGEGNMSSSR